jgi:hypothetical protein
VRRGGIEVELHVVGDTGVRRPREIAVAHPDLLFLHPRLPHVQSLAMAAGYDALLLALADLPNSCAVLSIKLPQYLLLNRPILAIVPEDSTVADIVKRTRRGTVVPPGPELATRLRASLERLRRGSDFAGGQSRPPEEFEARILARQWQAVISDLGSGLSASDAASLPRNGCSLTTGGACDFADAKVAPSQNDR